MQKKGFIYTWGLTMMFIIVMIIAMGKLEQHQNKLGKIGDKQNLIIDFVHYAEDQYFIFDGYAEKSTQIAIIDLAVQGGLKNPDCGVIQGYYLWNTLEKNCLPDKDLVVKNNLKNEILKNLGLYMIENSLLQPQNYELYLDDNGNLSVYGLSLKNIYLSIDDKDKIISSTELKFEDKPVYSFKPNFKSELKYDLKDYDYLKDQLQILTSEIVDCEKTKNFEDCIIEIIPKINNEKYSWEYLIEENRLVLFQVTSNVYKIPYYNKELSFKNPVYKFGYYIQDLPPEALNLDVLNPQGEDSYVMVKWDKSKERDISHYNLSYSDEKFTSLEGIETNIIEESTGHIFFEENCYFFNVNKECQHIIAPITTSISLSQVNNKYLCSGEYCYYITDEMKHIYITAVDNEGNAIKEGQSIELKTEDNLAPGIVSYDFIHDGSKVIISNIGVEKNANGELLTSETNDIKEYLIFISTNGDNLIRLENLRKISNGEGFEYPTTETVYVGIIAVDENKNPLERKGDGSPLEIKKEYELIIDDLANIKEVKP